MDENSKEDIVDSDVANMFSEMLEPTKEDLARKFSNEELIKLCLKRKCRVDMWKWNLVYEYRILFEEEGRYQIWDDRKRLKMLKKAVNIAKANIFYSVEEIAEARRKEWEWELKESILSLNLWEYCEKQKEADRTAGSDTNVNNQYVLNEPVEEQLNRAIVLNSATSASELQFSEANSDADICIPSNIKEKLSTVENNPDLLECFFDINTESLTIKSEMTDLSKEDNTPLPLSYYDFEKGTPIASTENAEF